MNEREVVSRKVSPGFQKKPMPISKNVFSVKKKKKLVLESPTKDHNKSSGANGRKTVKEEPLNVKSAKSKSDKSTKQIKTNVDESRDELLKSQSSQETSAVGKSPTGASDQSISRLAKRIDLKQYKELSKHLDDMKRFRDRRNKEKSKFETSDLASPDSDSKNGADGSRKRIRWANAATMEIFADFAKDLSKLSKGKDGKSYLALRRALVNELESLLFGCMKRASILNALQSKCDILEQQAVEREKEGKEEKEKNEKKEKEQKSRTEKKKRTQPKKEKVSALVDDDFERTKLIKDEDDKRWLDSLTQIERDKEVAKRRKVFNRNMKIAKKQNEKQERSNAKSGKTEKSAIDLTKYKDLSRHLNDLKNIYSASKEYKERRTQEGCSLTHQVDRDSEANNSKSYKEAEEKTKKKSRARADPATMEIFRLIANDLSKLTSKDNQANILLRTAIVNEIHGMPGNWMTTRSIIRNITVSIDKALIKSAQSDILNQTFKAKGERIDMENETSDSNVEEDVKCTFSSFKRIRGSTTHDLIFKDSHKARTKLAVTRCPTAKISAPTKAPIAVQK